MDKEKQIESMANAIEQARIKATDTTNSMNYGFGGWYAKELYNAGYRKASEVAREIFEEIDKIAMHNVTSSYGIWLMSMGEVAFAKLKKKYTEGER